ncbi:NMT1/THI5 like protein [compost metagenome]
MEARGLETNYFSFSDFGVNTLSIGIVSNPEYLASNKDIAKRFLRAIKRGIEDAQKDPDAAVAAAISALPQYEAQREVLLKQLKLTFGLLTTPDTTGKPLGWMSEADWQRTQRALVDYGGVKAVRQVSDYFSNDFIP